MTTERIGFMRGAVLGAGAVSMLVLAACVGGPGDPSGDGRLVDARESSEQSDEPNPENAEPRSADEASDAGDAGVEAR